MVKSRCTRYGLLALVTLVGCGGSTGDSAGGEGTSATLTSDLTVGGYYCPQSGSGIAGRNVPSDHTYFMTTFGGGPDTGPMACGGTADGTWLYVADAWRFGCGTHVRITNPHTGRWCVAQVADVGPNICVEQAAGRPIVDASPILARELFNAGGAGWSDRLTITAEEVPGSVQLGCGSGTPSSTSPSGSGSESSSSPGWYSATLGRQVPADTCVDSRLDGTWYQCVSGAWRTGNDIAGSHHGPAGACGGYFPLHELPSHAPVPTPSTCYSTTLGTEEPIGTCVQSRLDSNWYQCTSVGWLQGSDIASGHRGSYGACTSYNAL